MSRMLETLLNGFSSSPQSAAKKFESKTALSCTASWLRSVAYMPKLFLGELGHFKAELRGADSSLSVAFAFHIEDQLADFVWRWIRLTDEKIADWVDQAIKLDRFLVRTERKDQIPAEDERHSVSVIDIFRSFNQTIDQIVQLNWDDDLQYARFMTALAKVIGTGIARYCELVELKFTREMDRLTPEQEAAANQTRQEKWVRLAKDAWSNREKIEPFLFFPEVCKVF